MNIKNLFFLLLITIVTINCSSSVETSQSQEKAKEEIYVFDDVDVSDSIDVEKELPQLESDIPEKNIIDTLENIKSENPYFIVQVGAYSTKEKAEKFVNENKSLINYEMDILFSSEVNYYVIWLPKFDTRVKAENVRNELWKINKFKDAFILTKN